MRWKADEQRLMIKKSEQKKYFFFVEKKYFEKSKSDFFLEIVVEKVYQRISKFTKGFLDFWKNLIFQNKFSPRKKYFLCSDFFNHQSLLISFPTHLVRASLNNYLLKSVTDLLKCLWFVALNKDFCWFSRTWTFKSIHRELVMGLGQIVTKNWQAPIKGTRGFFRPPPALEMLQGHRGNYLDMK